MDIHSVIPTLCVSPQIQADDLETLARLGYRTIICNRPDGEAVDQPQSSVLANYASRLGIEFFYQPVISGQIEPADGEQFAQLLTRAKPPVLAYCRTGTRSIILWALSERGKQTPAAIRQLTVQAGYQIGQQYIEGQA